MKIRVGKLGAHEDIRPVKNDLPYAKVAHAMASAGRLRVPQLSYDARMLERYPILDNDKYGCCTFSSIVRKSINDSIRRGKPISVKPGAVARAYLDMTGGKDDGAMEVNSLTYMRSHGVELSDGSMLKVRAFARVDEQDPYQMASALQTFHGLVVTAGLPARLDEDRDNRLELTPRDQRTKADEPRSMGGHAYNVFSQQRRAQGVVLWEDRMDEEESWTYEYREEAWVFTDNQETDQFLIDTMDEQLALFKAS